MRHTGERKQELEPVWGVDVSFSHMELEAPVGASGGDVQWAVSKYGCGAPATCTLDFICVLPSFPPTLSALVLMGSWSLFFFFFLM